MFKIRLTINQALLARLRELPERTQRNLRREIVTKVGPEMQSKLDEVIHLMGPVKKPFVLPTEASDIYYHEVILPKAYAEGRANKDPITGKLTWRREGFGAIEKAWRVEVSDRFRGNIIRIVNIQRQSSSPQGVYPAQYVVGANALQGHIESGWIKEWQANKRWLQGEARKLISAAARSAIRDATKGVDSH